MKLSIVIPCYNEENTIVEVLGQINELNLDKEIIVVDDGSTDGSREKLENLKKKFKFKLLDHKENLGKGRAIRTALNFVSGDYTIIQDADLEYDPEDYQELLECAFRNEAKVVYGSRQPNLQNRRYSSLLYYLGGVFLTWLTNILYGTRITDVTTCYKLFKTNVIKKLSLKCKGFEFCPEVTVKLVKKGIKIYEVPIKYFPRGSKEGKKLKWKDGLKIAWTLIKYRFFD